VPPRAEWTGNPDKRVRRHSLDRLHASMNKKKSEQGKMLGDGEKGGILDGVNGSGIG